MVSLFNEPNYGFFMKFKYAKINDFLQLIGFLIYEFCNC